MRVYLAGPIHSCTDSQALAWRQTIKDALRDYPVEFVDPTKRDYRGQEEEMDVAQIVEPDLADIANCDLVIAHVWRESAGTAMEIRYAAAERKIPVWAFGTKPLSPWIAYHARVFNAAGDVILELARHAAVSLPGDEQP